jgi:hypothetical protein
VRRANKRDDIEPVIVAALERCGCSVERIDGAPFDLLVLRVDRVFLMEVKSSAAAARAKTAPNKRQADFRRRGWPVHVVLTPADALRVVGFVNWRAVVERNAARTEANIAAALGRAT